MDMSYVNCVGDTGMMTGLSPLPWNHPFPGSGEISHGITDAERREEASLDVAWGFACGKTAERTSTDVYWQLQEARQEVWQRWHDNSLRARVCRYVGELPHCFRLEPRAVLFRNIASPHAEYCHFAEQASLAGVKPLAVEYLNDRFSTRNPDKINLAKLPIYLGANKHGQPMVSYSKVIDLKAADNRRFVEIDTLWGGNLVDFHHGLLTRNLPDLEVFDISGWQHFSGNRAAEYYKYFLSLFVCNGILFENFVTNDQEQLFFDTVVAPAIAEIESVFGVAPLIVKAVTDSNPSDVYWSSYPKQIATEIQETLAFIRAESKARTV